MEYEGYVMELWAEGYRGRPSPEVAEKDAEVVEESTCCWCNRSLQYEGFVNPNGRVGHRYVALAVCHECDYCEEF